MTSDFYSWAIIILALLLSFIFSGSETAFLTSNKILMDFKAKQNPKRYKSLHRYILNPDLFLITILVGNNIVAVTFATVATIQFDKTFGPQLSWLINTLIILFIGEIIPKSLFRSIPNLILPPIIPIVRLFHILFQPLIKLVQYITVVFFRVFNLSNDTTAKILTRDELENLLLHITSEKIEKADKQRIIKMMLELEDTNVKSIMIPRPDVVSVPIEYTPEKIQQKFIETGVSRILVYEYNLDHILGFVHFQDFIFPESTWKDKIIPIIFFPETKKLREALSEFKKRNEKIAVVIDEHGGIEGLVTIENILEKIIGEIQDEFDFEEENITYVRDDIYLIKAQTSVEELEERLHLVLPKSEDFQTIAGFLLKVFGRIPKVGNEYIFEEKWKFIVIEVMRTGIKFLRVQKLNDDDLKDKRTEMGPDNDSKTGKF